MSTIPANRIFTERELAYLHRMGYRPDRYYTSTGEVLTYVADRPYAFPAALLKAWANPPWYDRLRNWIAKVAA